MKFKLKNLIVLLLTLFFIFTYFLPVFADSKEPEISSEAAILVDNYTGTILYGKNIDQKMYPASTTKILTAILTIENCKLDDKATASYNAIMSVPSGYSIGEIKVGEELTVEQLLEVLMVHSANDAANVLGEHVGGSIESFATMMNTKALEIGCKNSNFVNPSGKHADDHYTTAKDLALIMQYCMKNPTFRKLSSMRSCALPATDKSAERKFATTVEILIPNTKNTASNYYYPYAIAGKTGFTTEAKNCLVSVANKDELELTSVILGSSQTSNGLSYRFIETKEIYEYGFNNFSMKKICSKGDVAKQLDISNATKETKKLDVTISEDINVLAKQSSTVSKSSDNKISEKSYDYLLDIKPDIKITENIQAPISEGQQLGTITYTVNGVGYTTNLVASHNVDKSSFSFLLIACLSIVLILFILVILLTSHKKRRIKRKR